MNNYRDTYTHALNVVMMYEELEQLREENEYLRIELAKSNQSMNEQFTETNNQISDILLAFSKNIETSA